MSTLPATFAAVAVTLFAAHQVADHTVGQTDGQAAHKADPGRVGWLANLAHVVQYHAVLSVMLGASVLALDLRLPKAGVVTGLLISMVSHSVLDRRWPVRWILEHSGGRQFAALAGGGMSGMYLSDQALHIGCLWLAALVMVRPLAGLAVAVAVGLALAGWALWVRRASRLRTAAVVESER